MNHHALHSIVIEAIERPEPALIQRWRGSGLDVAQVGDAMGAHGIMNWEIKPLAWGMRVLGPAVTVLTRPGDALFIQKVADVAQPGDVVVVDAGGCRDAAHFGERIGYYMRKRGLEGLVIDGAVRDRAGLVEIGFPTFARAVTPRIYGTSGPGAINVPVQCGGVAVQPGDLVMGDDDGVVVVPRADVERVLAAAQAHLAGELDRLGRVERGERLSDINGCDAKIARWLEH